MFKTIYFLRIVSFALTLLIGIGSASVLTGPAPSCSDTPRFRGINPSERFFKLDEIGPKIGREVRYAKPTVYQNTGRVVWLDLVQKDRWFAIVYWDASPDSGKPGIRHYSKDSYEELVEEVAIGMSMEQ